VLKAVVSFFLWYFFASYWYNGCVPYILIIAAIATGFIALAVLINKKLGEIAQKQKPSEELMSIVTMLEHGSREDRKVLLDSLDKNSQVLGERLDNAARVISAVQKNIGEMSEIGRSMQELQLFLKSPKLRGNIGEQILKELLTQYLPKSSFHLQYAFRSGEKVDAAIQTSAGIVPIDSKFPLENFRAMNESREERDKAAFARQFERDVRKHIEDISRKYILTEEGTIDYALMYVPSEAVYYEIVNNQSLFEYSGKHRVLPVSPTTFYAYMKAILMSFEGQKIEASAREILSSLRGIQKDYEKVETGLSTLSKHMTNANNMMDNVSKEFKKLGGKIKNARALEDKTPKTLLHD
jgi:DNA recombination protein RmuC